VWGGSGPWFRQEGGVRKGKRWEGREGTTADASATSAGSKFIGAVSAEDSWTKVIGGINYHNKEWRRTAGGTLPLEGTIPNYSLRAKQLRIVGK